MNQDIIGAVIAALIGVGVAFINYLISKYVLIKSPQKYSFTTVVRQVVQVGFLVAVYLVGQRTAFDPIYLLIGAVLGMTLPMFYFTKRLLNFNEALHNKETGKEEDDDG